MPLTPRNRGQMHIGVRSVQWHTFKDPESGVNVDNSEKSQFGSTDLKNDPENLFLRFRDSLRSCSGPHGAEESLRKSRNNDFPKEIQ